MILWLLSCTMNKSDVTDTGFAQSNDALVMAMVAFDYSVGSLAHFDLETEVLTEDIASISGDPVVRYDEGALWQLNRYQYDTLRKYSPSDLRAAPQEVSLANEVGSSNPHDVEVCGSNLFVSLFGSEELAVLNPDTLADVGAIDLSMWADEDGLPEASALVEWNDSIFVGLQRLDRNDGFTPLTSVVLRIDCSSFTVLGSWEIGTNIDLVLWDDQVVLVTQESESEPAGLLQWNSSEESFQRFWTAETAMSAVNIQGDRLFYTSLSPDFSSYQLHCVDVEEGTQASSELRSEYVTDLWIQDESTGWMSTHWGWNDASNASVGLSRVDLQSCKVSQQWETLLAPFSLAFVP